MSDAPIKRVATAFFGLAVVVVLAAFFTSPDSTVGTVARIVLTPDFLSAALQAAVPLTLAGIGGLYAEKSGIINIGIEGLLIVSAFASVTATYFSIESGVASGQAAIWLGLLAGVAVSTLFALLFAVICIEFKADQIIAGLAVWLVALGLAPFATKVIWGQVISESVPTFDRVDVPGLVELPWIGSVLFDVYPTTALMLVLVPIAWYVLDRTPYGTWVKASGERPETLATAGVSVRTVRYTSVLVSGVLSGIGGAALTLSSAGQFIGQGQTMVNGRGFIAIVAYLLGNYNPAGTFVSALLFAGLDAFQVRFQQLNLWFELPASLVGVVPHITVIVVLVFFGYTRIPDRAGEHYEAGEE